MLPNQPQDAADIEVEISDVEVDDADEKRGLDDEDGMDANGEELRSCVVCLQQQPLGKFPMKNGQVKGRMCLECSSASEAMQRLLRAGWGAEYKERYNGFKKEKALWNKSVLGLKNDPSKKKKRTFNKTASTLKQVKRKGKVRKSRTVKVPMTFSKYDTFFKKEENGGYTATQNQERWNSHYADPLIQRDEEGVEAGVEGKLQMYVPIEKQVLSDSESGEEKVFEEEAKLGKGKQLSEEDLGQWWMIGEVQDKDYVDRDIAVLLCDSIDRRLGRPLMVRTQSTHEGSKTSVDTSGARGVDDDGPAEGDGPTKADEKAKAKWQRDRHGKIEAEKERRRQDLIATRLSLEQAVGAIREARLEVLVKDASVSRKEDPHLLELHGVQVRDCTRRTDLVERIFETNAEGQKAMKTLKTLQDDAVAAGTNADLVVVNLMSLELWSAIDTMEDLVKATSEEELKEQVATSKFFFMRKVK